MATATSKRPTKRDLRRQPTDGGAPVPSMEFLILEDNAGDYYWTIVAGNGATLARSPGFASCALATQAVEQLRDGVASARFGASVASGAVSK